MEISSKLIKEELDKCIENGNFSVIMIKGEWGIGKTYWWKSYHESLKKSKSKQLKYEYEDVLYCSLFGVENIQEIKNKLVFGNNLKKENTVSVIDSLLSSSTKKSLGGIAITGIAKIASEIYQTNVLKNKIIVLDDIERISIKLEIDALMGMINDLKEKQNNNQIILILNEDELINKINNDKSSWQKFKEKIVEREIKLNITPSEVLDIIKNIHNIEDKSESCILLSLVSLNIKNIRIADLIFKHLKEIENMLDFNQNQIIKGMAIIFYLYYTCKDISYKDLFIYILNYTDKERQYNKYLSIYGDKKTEVNDEEEMVLEKLKFFEFQLSSELTRLCIDYINNGFFDEEKLLTYQLNHEKDFNKEANDFLLLNYCNRLHYEINYDNEQIKIDFDNLLKIDYTNYSLIYDISLLLKNINIDKHKETVFFLSEKIRNGLYDPPPSLLKNELDFRNALNEKLNKVDDVDLFSLIEDENYFINQSKSKSINQLNQIEIENAVIKIIESGRTKIKKLEKFLNICYQAPELKVFAENFTCFFKQMSHNNKLSLRTQEILKLNCGKFINDSL